MRRRSTLSSLIVAYSLVWSVSGLQVTPGSYCASACLDSSSGDPYSAASSTTYASDIVCDDSDYFSSSNGVKFKDCLKCLKTSKEVNGSESDSSWFIYNLRFASAVCLYDYPKHEKNSTSSCDLSSACLPLQTALETGLNLAKSPSEFGYCSADNSAFYGTGIDDCVSCLQSSTDTYGANFLLALQAGCEQQPTNGTLLNISGNIFSEYPINFTSSSSNHTNITTTSNTSTSSDAVLSPGGIAGIALAAGGLLLIAAMLFGVHWRRQKRWQKEDQVGFVDPHEFYGKGFSNGGDMATLSSANSYQPRFTHDHKTAAAAAVAAVPPPAYKSSFTSGNSSYDPAPDGEDFEMGYTNNAEYYDRMEGKSRGRQLQRPLNRTRLSEEFNSAAHVDTSALPTHPAYIPRDRLTPSRVGSRASHRSTPTSARSSASAAADELRSQQQQRQQQQQHLKYKKPDPYTIQVYLNSVEDAKIPPPTTNPLSQHPTDGISRDVGINRETSLRDVKIELAGPAAMSAPSYEHLPTTTYDNNTTNDTHLRQGGRITPHLQQGSTYSRSITPAPPSVNGGRATPAPSVRSRAPSLILPSVPRIGRGSSKKPAKLSIDNNGGINNTNMNGESYKQQVPYGRGENIGITGPLAFPDSRFTMRHRSGEDRIVEQTVDRAAHPHVVEVPIGSGKSYLYG